MFSPKEKTMPHTDTSARRDQFRQALQLRHATKSFDPSRKITPEDFQFLLEAAHLSPTSFGLEPWRLVVVQDPALRESLKTVTWGAQGQLPTSSHFVALTVLRGTELEPQGSYIPGHLASKGYPADRVAGTQAKLAGFFHDEQNFATPELRTEWAARQAYIALGNMMTAAAFVGIDSCPIEGFHQKKLEEILAGHGGYDPKTHAVVCLAAFGYREKEPHARLRKPLDQSVGWA
jgi:nitroreductase